MVFLDNSWRNEVLEAIEEGISSTVAIRKIINRYKEKFSHDAYWSSRFFDYEIIFEQIITNLVEETENNYEPIKSPMILIAQTISPKDVLTFHQKNCVGIVLADTGSSSHGAIVAKSLNIPIVGGIFNAKKRIENEDELMIDGSTGFVIVKPKKYDFDRAKRSHITVIGENNNKKITTKDGVEIKLYLNANLPDDIKHIHKVNSSGIGLFRSEIAFLSGNSIPSFSEQVDMYYSIFNDASERPIYFRTLDIRSDKVVHTVHDKQKKSNEQYEVRTLMLQQIRALVEAKKACNFPDYPLFIMLPMVTQASEFIEIKEMIISNLYTKNTSKRNIARTLKIGTMIEVPSLVYDLDALLPHLDFCSIGSNDLFHFFFGLDRNQVSLTGSKNQMLSLPFLRFLKMIIDKSNDYNCPISLCGEMASRPLEALALIGTGLMRLSLNMYEFTKIQKTISRISFTKLSRFVQEQMQKNSANDFPNEMEKFCKKYDIVLTLDNSLI